MKKIALMVLFFFLFSSLLMSQTFLHFPTKNFDLFYEEGTKEQAIQLLEQGNNIYEELSGFYNVTLKEKLRVYLLDGVDFSNAYADFFSNAVFIYVNRNHTDYYDNSFEWWVPFVFSHELTHILVANKSDWIKDFLDLFGHPVSMLFDTAFTPSFLHEGLSIYSESFFSDKGRLNDDRYFSYLSAEIQDSNFKGLSLSGSMNSPQFTPTGYNYLYGAYFIDYIDEKYGKDRVSELVKDYASKYRFNFKKMIEAISGLKFSIFIAEWKQWLQEKTSFEKNIENSSYQVINITNSGYYSGINSCNKNNLFYFEQKDGSQTVLKKWGDSVSESMTINFPTDFEVSPSGQLACIYANSNGFEKYNLALYIGNYNGEFQIIKEITRPKTVTWQNDDIVLYTYLEKGGTGLSSYNLKTKEKKDYLHPNGDFYINNLSVDESICYMSISFNGNSDLYRLDLNSGEIYSITNTPENEIDVFANKGYLYYSSNFESFYENHLAPYNVFSLNLLNGEKRKLTNHLWGAYSPAVFGGEVYFRGYSGAGFDLYKLVKAFDDVVIVADNKENSKVFVTDFVIEEDMSISNLIKKWDYKKTPIACPRFGIPLILPSEGDLYGIAGIAGWDDLKEWIWYGYIMGMEDYKKWDYSVIHRGMLDLTTTWNGDSNYEEFKTSIKFPFYIRENEKYMLLRPGIDLGLFHTAENLKLRTISDFSMYMSLDYIGYPDNPVKVPEFYQLIQMGTSGYYSQTGIGLALPFSVTGMIRQRTNNGNLRLSAEGWYPINWIDSLGTDDGKFRLSSFTIHFGENIDIEDDFKITPSGILGLWIDFGIQYWVDLKLVLDFEIGENGVKPIIGIQNSIL
jgi:hypothetical protein